MTLEFKEELLRELQYPTANNLPQLIAETLTKKKQPVKFGSLKIHNNLTLDQLNALRQLAPSLIDDESFISAVILRLVTDLKSNGCDSSSSSMSESSEVYLSVLRKLHSFVNQLAPVFNNYRSAVLLQWLKLQIETGKFEDEASNNVDVLMEYLRTPRRNRRSNKNYISQQERQDRRCVVDRLVVLPGFTEIPPEEEDAILKQHLVHHFVSATSIKPYASYLDETFLRNLFAEVKLLYGEGNPEEHLKTLKGKRPRSTMDTSSSFDDGDSFPAIKQSKGSYYGDSFAAIKQSKGILLRRGEEGRLCSTQPSSQTEGSDRHLRR